MATGHGPRNNLEKRPKDMEAVFVFPRKKVRVTNNDEKYRARFFGIFRYSSYITDKL